MRFSTRSKVSILLSLTILLALAGGFFVYGAIGSKHAAHAAGGPTMTVGHLTYLGTSSIKPSRAASTTGSVSNEISVQPQDDIAKTGTPGPSTPTTAPNPTQIGRAHV